MKRLVLCVCVVVCAVAIDHVRLLLSMANGFSAKYMCSSIFLADRNEQQLYEEDFSEFPFRYTTYVIDRDSQSVTSSIGGLFRRKAIYRPGLGATLISELSEDEIRSQSFRIATSPDSNQDEIPWPVGNQIDGDRFPSNINRTSLNDAVNSLFVEKDPNKRLMTRAVLVLYDGKLVAEQYACGFSKVSKFLGWSMTKSIISALIGILVNDKKLNVDDPAPVPEWNDIADRRRAITTKHLLQQTSGLDFNENYNSKSQVTEMLFNRADMGAFAASHPLKVKPGTECYYSSGNTNVLSRIIRHITGDDDYHSFPYRRLFYKLGMNSITMEVDASGTFVGSSYSWATARDWARFGLLYLNNGSYNNEQILSEDWIKQTATLAGSNQYGEYGLHFWLNTGKGNEPSTRKYPDVPADMFYASGFDGQNIFVVPSKKLVVVRLGLTKSSDGAYGANCFLKNVIDSIN